MDCTCYIILPFKWFSNGNHDLSFYGTRLTGFPTWSCTKLWEAVNFVIEGDCWHFKLPLSSHRIIFHCLYHGWWTSFRRNGVRNDLCDWFASIYVTGSQWWKGWDQSSTGKKGEYDPSLASVCYHLFLKYHIVLSDFQAGYSHQETTNCNIQS